MVVLLVAWPKNNIFSGKKYEHLVDWRTINDSFPWYIILLGGGGLALAEGFEVDFESYDFVLSIFQDNASFFLNRNLSSLSGLVNC